MTFKNKTLFCFLKEKYYKLELVFNFDLFLSISNICEMKHNLKLLVFFRNLEFISIFLK